MYRVTGLEVVLVQIRDLIFDIPSLRIHSNCHMSKGKVWMRLKKPSFEDLVEMSCGENFGSFISLLEEVVENAAEKTGSICKSNADQPFLLAKLSS